MHDESFADGVDMLDSLVDFHPDWFAGLSAAERSDLDAYYGVTSHPADLLHWRDRHLEQDPGLADRARAVLRAFPGLDIAS